MSMIMVLLIIIEALIDRMENYQFVFDEVFIGMTNELSLALQQKDQNIVQAVID